ncbi:hypothetical protein PybrP1_005613 [[Pythium] brassicae (nom. inval.)]|nr:hypothetical protein PybrP1_005613 [[Pythium] brassicae (nom. inval.)]
MRRHMRSSALIGRRQRALGSPAGNWLALPLHQTLPPLALQEQQRQWQVLAALNLRNRGATRGVSTWKLAAGGLQRKWKGIKQRTAWRFKTLKDKNTLVVFNADHQTEKEIHIKPRNNHADDPMACHNVLGRVSAASLNGILGATSPQDSNEFVRTMTGFMLHACSPAARAQVLDVITSKRLREISISNRAVVIRAIQRCLLSPLHTEKAVLHSAACNVIRGTFGKDLALLKDLVHSSEELLDAESELVSEVGEVVDGAGLPDSPPLASAERPPVSAAQASLKLQQADEEPPHSGDLSHLIFQNKNLTEVVLVMQHIAVEALKVKTELPGLVKVVSDIDDTLFPGWLDRRYPLHIPYPGVSDLFARISRGLAYQETGKGAEKLPPSITFLTARPRGWLSVGRYMTVQHLKSLGVPNATVLNGSVKGLVSSKKIASMKMENFTRFASLYPEFSFVFFGDSGQGDALLASKLLQAFPEQVLGTFIHDVNPASARTGDGQEKATYRSEGVDFFSTYAGAALAAYQKDLIEKQDLLEIVARAESELDRLLFSGPNAEALKRERRLELESDAEQVLRAVQESPV